MFGKEFQRKYALTEQGVHNTKMGTIWTVIVNLVVMGGMGILYLMMNGFVGTLTEGKPLPGTATILLLVLGFLVLSFITHLQQYKATYGLVYREVKNVRISLAERLRKLPLGYFGKRDLADLTETIMGDVNRLELSAVFVEYGIRSFRTLAEHRHLGQLAAIVECIGADFRNARRNSH